ncbi:MAG: STAS domain-containing protein, partial [Clostridia bacterium]|nr:STAS domain-containing protein [Clostridia bacterium]
MPLLISKIESKLGVKNMDEIIAVSDGVMVARGDLGVEVDFEKLPYIQKQLIERCNKQGVKLILSHTNQSVFNSLKKSKLVEVIGEENIVPHINDAVILAEKYVSNQCE